jgi:exocyst complex component 7
MHHLRLIILLLYLNFPKARLVETGSKKLAQMFTALAAEGSQGAGFPPHVLSALRPLVDFLRTLPTPPTHPSHPAAAVIQTSLRDAQRGYGEMRGAAIRRVLESGSKNVLEAAEGDGVAAGQTLERWLNDFLAYAEVHNIYNFQ